MNKQIVPLLICALVAQPVRSQVSRLIPAEARDSLAAADARSPAARSDRQRRLDSLTAGRRRWTRAHVGEYRLQVHTDCFCIPQDSVSERPLVTVRNGAIVAHARGRPATGIVTQTTIDSLFALIERDLRDPGRVVRQLNLDRRYGFPLDYFAETPTIPDLWLRIHVDSFAVTHGHAPAVTKRLNSRRDR